MPTPKLKPIREQVIVITGASSGIGLATARLAAERGARVVLAARTEDALRRAVEEIERAGGQATFLVADVGERSEVEAIAAHAIHRFGGFDTWVNNAGVGILGKVGEVTDEDQHQLFRTNFWGQVYGMEVASDTLRGRGGVIINVGSVESDRGFPLHAIYAASKHAIKGYTDAFRAELMADGAPVQLTLIKPASVGTPFPQHMRKYSEREPKLPPPVYAPEEVAKTILYCAEHPKRDAFVGGSARTMSGLGITTPGFFDWLQSKAINSQLGPEPATPTDALYGAQAEGEERGDMQGSTIRPSLYTTAARNPAATVALAGAAAAGLFLWRRSRDERMGRSAADADEQEVEAHPS